MALSNLYRAQNAGGTSWVDSVGTSNIYHYYSPNKNNYLKGYIRYSGICEGAWGVQPNSKYIMDGSSNNTWLLHTHALGGWAIFLKFRNLGGSFEWSKN